MPFDITEDIGREIVECTVAQTGGRELSALRTLSLTNKLLRDIAVPILFRSLRFDNKAFYDADAFNTTLTHLIWTYIRIRSLLGAPHLLQHVREIFMNQWSRNVFWSVGTGVDTMATVVYKFLIDLIARMPRLQHIEVSTSHIGPRLLRLLLSGPQIDKLTLSPGTQDFAADIPPGLPISHRIRHFHYFPDGNPSPIDAYFRVILEHCSQELQSLEIPSAELPRVIDAASHHAMSLRTLIVNCNHYSSGVIQDLWNLLPLCPELRVLRIDPFMLGQLSSHLAPDIIPHLESLSVQPKLAPIFTAGRTVKNMTVIGLADMAFHSVEDIVGSPTALRQLNLALSIDNHQELIWLIRCLNICPALVILRVTFLNRSRWVPLNKQMTPEEHEELMDGLRRLTALRVCDMTGFSPSGYPTEMICPIGTMRNPDDRGHLSLESVRISCIDRNWWVWFRAEGWQRMPDSYHSQYEL